MASFPQASPPTPCAHLYPPPYAPNALPISFVSILPPAHYWVRSTDNSAPRYAAFSIPLSPRPYVYWFRDYKYLPSHGLKVLKKFRDTIVRTFQSFMVPPLLIANTEM